MSTETDNDRQTALAIAQSHADASVDLAQIQVIAIIAQADRQAFAITRGAEIANQSRIAVATSQIGEIYALGATQVETIYGDADDAINEAAAVAGLQAAATYSIAQADSYTTYAESLAQASAALAESASRGSADQEVARLQSDAADRESAIDVAETRRTGEIQVQESAAQASIRQSESARSAASEAGATAQSAANETASQIYVATSATRAAGQVAAIDAGASLSGARVDADATLYGSMIQGQIARLDADSQARLTRSGASQDRQTSDQVAQLRHDAETYGADERYAEIVAKEDAADAKLARLQAYAEQKFQRAFEAARQASQLPLSIPAPPFPVDDPGLGGVFTPRQIRQFAATNRAQAATAVASTFRQAQGSAAGRGLAGTSPFLVAAQAVAAVRAASEAEAQVLARQVEGAKANADQILQGAKLRGSRVISQAKIAAAARVAAADYQVALVDAAASAASGIN